MGLRKAGGNWVAGDRFFDREAEIEALIERVEDGIHTLVTAQRRRNDRREASMDDIDTVYSQDMLGVRGQVYLEHYQSRLRMVLGDDGYVVALELLTQAAVSGGRLTDDSIRQYEAYRSVLSGESGGQVGDVLHVLEHDGYLVRRDGGYHFVSGLVEDWWRARNAGGFVPFGDRYA